jgi:hypothetical protein
MMRSIAVLALLLGAPALARAQQCQAAPPGCSAPVVTISITVGRAVNLVVSPTATTLTQPAPADYNTGYASTNGPTATMKANSAWTLGISTSAATWTGVDTGTELAWKTKPASDLRWATSIAGVYTGMTTTSATIASGNATAGTAVTLFYRTLYAWANDTPGNYSIQVVFTIVAP